MSLKIYNISLLLQGGANVQETSEERVKSEADSSIVVDEDVILKGKSIPHCNY